MPYRAVDSCRRHLHAPGTGAATRIRGHAETLYQAKFWAKARLCTKRRPRPRYPFVATSFATGWPSRFTTPSVLQGPRNLVKRNSAPMGGRPSPDAFGKLFHVASPLQDSVGVITPSSLHYVATTRGSFIPDIDPKEHTLMIHGLVDQPLTFTMEDLKRLPSVTRLHFIECAGNRHNGRQRTVQESHGMTSCAEWTGVLLSTLLKECGLKGSATWFVAEGAEEVKGASSMPIAMARGAEAPRFSEGSMSHRAL